MDQFTANEPAASLDTFNPTLADAEWAAREFDHADPPVPTVPVNGQPVTLAEYVDDEARAYRSQGTAWAAFLADHLERLGQLIRWTGATAPAEHIERMEVWDEEIRAKEFDRGYSEGAAATRRELAIYLPG